MFSRHDGSFSIFGWLGLHIGAAKHLESDPAYTHCRKEERGRSVAGSVSRLPRVGLQTLGLPSPRSAVLDAKVITERERSQPCLAYDLGETSLWEVLTTTQR